RDAFEHSSNRCWFVLSLLYLGIGDAKLMHEDLLPDLQLTRRAGIIELGWGHPDPALLPASEMRVAATETLDRCSPIAPAYGANQGAGLLLAWLRRRIALTEGREPLMSEIALTGGVTHAIDLMCTLFTQPGDVVLVEEPTYHLAIQMLRERGLELVPVPMDEEGLQIEALEKTLEDLR